jgi:hypothetical protein
MRLGRRSEENMSTHHLCKTNCGGTDCDAPRRIEAARQTQPEEELRRKAEKSARHGYWTQEQIDLIPTLARKLLEKFKAARMADDA